MIAKYKLGALPSKTETDLKEELKETLHKFKQHMEELQVHSALDVAMDLARKANAYIDQKEPWAMARDTAQVQSLDTTLATLHRILTLLTILLFPVMPEKMSELARRLGLSTVPTLNNFDVILSERSKVEEGSPLFPKDIL